MEWARYVAGKRKRAGHTASQQYDADHQDPPQESVGLEQEGSFGKFHQDEPRRTNDRPSHSHNGISVSRVMRNLECLTQTNRWQGHRFLDVGKDISPTIAVVQGRITTEQIRKLLAGVGRR